MWYGLLQCLLCLRYLRYWKKWRVLRGWRVLRSQRILSSLCSGWDQRTCIIGHFFLLQIYFSCFKFVWYMFSFTFIHSVRIIRISFVLVLRSVMSKVSIGICSFSFEIPDEPTCYIRQWGIICIYAMPSHSFAIFSLMFLIMSLGIIKLLKFAFFLYVYIVCTYVHHPTQLLLIFGFL